MKTTNLLGDNFKKILELDGSTPESAMGSSDIGQRIPCRAIDHNIDVQYVCIISFPVLSNYLESMRMNIDRDLVKQ